MNYGDQQLPTREEYELKARIRNETIDELCAWLHSCIEHVDHETEVFKACTAMVNAMQGKKTGITATLGTGVASDGSVVTHHPLSHDPMQAARDSRK
jgi:hypothetical protein